MSDKIVIRSNTVWEDQVGYSRAIKVKNIVEIAGTTATDGDRIVGEGDAFLQTVFTLKKIETTLNQLGVSLNNVIRTRIFITRHKDWKKVGKAHAAFFKDIKPVCTMVVVAGLIDERLLVEIEASAVLEDEW